MCKLFYKTLLILGIIFIAVKYTLVNKPEVCITMKFINE